MSIAVGRADEGAMVADSGVAVADVPHVVAGASADCGTIVGPGERRVSAMRCAAMSDAVRVAAAAVDAGEGLDPVEATGLAGSMAAAIVFD